MRTPRRLPPRSRRCSPPDPELARAADRLSISGRQDRLVAETEQPLGPWTKRESIMSANGTYLAVFLGSKSSPRRAAWDALPEGERRMKEQEGIAAWKAWVEKHQAAIVAMGGPLGKTKKVTQRGVDDISNQMGAFTVVRAESHAAAAKLFEKHPHFTIFPGDSVEIMPVLPIPGA
jgi:hypothetical protein